MGDKGLFWAPASCGDGSRPAAFDYTRIKSARKKWARSYKDNCNYLMYIEHEVELFPFYVYDSYQFHEIMPPVRMEFYLSNNLLWHNLASMPKTDPPHRLTWPLSWDITLRKVRDNSNLVWHERFDKENLSLFWNFTSMFTIIAAMLFLLTSKCLFTEVIFAYFFISVTIT